MTTSLEILLVEDNEGDVEMTECAFHDDKSTCNISIANDGWKHWIFCTSAESFLMPLILSLSYSISICRGWME